MEVGAAGKEKREPPESLFGSVGMRVGLKWKPPEQRAIAVGERTIAEQESGLESSWKLEQVFEPQPLQAEQVNWK